MDPRTAGRSEGVKPAPRSLLFAFLSAGALGGCGGSSSSAPSAATPAPEAHSTEPVSTKVTAFAVHPENLNVDRIGMKDGAATPDGNRDLVFTATVEGPVDALYLVTTDSKGAPVHGFRADTIAGGEDLPQQLAAAGQVDTGKLTVWIAVVEDNHFVNTDGGRLRPISKGSHDIKLYAPNTGTLRPGSHLRLYARGQGGAIVGGPVVPY